MNLTSRDESDANRSQTFLWSLLDTRAPPQEKTHPHEAFSPAEAAPFSLTGGASAWRKASSNRT